MNVESRERQPEKTKHPRAWRHAGKIATMIVLAVLSHGLTKVLAQYLWFRTSDLYGETMFIVRSSPDLEQKIGAPVVAGWPRVSRSIFRGAGTVNAHLPIRGPRGGATVQIRAKNRGGSWEYQQLVASIDTEGSSVDLMPHSWHPRKLVLRGSGRLYFVGIGELSRLDVEQLARFYDDRYDLDITVLPSVAYSAHYQPAKRMIRDLKAGFPRLVTDPQSVIIAVTDVDMEWYSWREDGRFGVVSTAGLTLDGFLKQLTKCLGILWFELPLSADSRSVLYDRVDGTVDLEMMSDEF